MLNGQTLLSAELNVNGALVVFCFRQVESRQVISGTEEGPRRPEKGQLLTSARARRRGRLGAPLKKLHTNHRQIHLLQTQVLVFGNSFFNESCVC